MRILTGPGQPLLDGALEVEGSTIRALGLDLPPPAPLTRILDRTGMIVLPGFVQGHIHLCQTLFRGLADGRRLDRWLRERIWPLEGMLDPDSLRAAARLGIAETLLHGATTLLDMGTVAHTEVIAEAAEEMGVRAILGKALMDAGDGIPAELHQDPEDAFAEALQLYERWNGRAEGRLKVAFAPRFTLSVSARLWREIAAQATRRRILVHTHVSETPWENETCTAMHGTTPIRALEQWGILEAPAVLVHAVWTDPGERAALARHGTGVIHCPGSNARLGSGIAPLAQLLEAGVAVGLGSDGAACNDALSIPADMRLAAQLQDIAVGPGAVSAQRVFAMATSEGARAIAMAGEIGTLSAGKRADFQLYPEGELGWPGDLPIEDRLVRAVPAARPAEVYVDGRPLVADGRLTGFDLEELRREALRQRGRLRARFAERHTA
ncbi:MAG: amidohydrolase family protein [Candidatus Eisenbacteria bacterium]